MKADAASVCHLGPNVEKVIFSRWSIQRKKSLLTPFRRLLLGENWTRYGTSAQSVWLVDFFASSPYFVVRFMNSCPNMHVHCFCSIPHPEMEVSVEDDVPHRPSTLTFPPGRWIVHPVGNASSSSPPSRRTVVFMANVLPSWRPRSHGVVERHFRMGIAKGIMKYYVRNIAL